MLHLPGTSLWICVACLLPAWLQLRLQKRIPAAAAPPQTLPEGESSLHPPELHGTWPLHLPETSLWICVACPLPAWLQLHLQKRIPAAAAQPQTLPEGGS